MANQKVCRILSLDGGGIRGLITALWLKRLEDELKEPLYRHFDIIAGTSTGAILACGVAKGMSPSRIVDLYINQGKEVFPGPASRLWSRGWRSLSQGISAPKYDGKGLKRVLKSVFRGARFGSLKQLTMVVTYDVTQRRPIVFKTSKAEHADLSVWKLCAASSSAPTYFPAHLLELADRRVPLIDGGVVANNPTACAIAEAAKHHPSIPVREFVVASFGTGESTRSITADEALEWGAAEWAIPIIDVLFDGSADSVDYIAQQLIPQYFRFQAKLDKAYDDMDNADATNLAALERIAKGYLKNEGESKIVALAKLLKESV